jgi:hypothetical protein
MTYVTSYRSAIFHHKISYGALDTDVSVGLEVEDRTQVETVTVLPAFADESNSVAKPDHRKIAAALARTHQY